MPAGAEADALEAELHSARVPERVVADEIERLRAALERAEAELATTRGADEPAVATGVCVSFPAGNMAHALGGLSGGYDCRHWHARKLAALRARARGPVSRQSRPEIWG